MEYEDAGPYFKEGKEDDLWDDDRSGMYKTGGVIDDPWLPGRGWAFWTTLTLALVIVGSLVCICMFCPGCFVGILGCLGLCVCSECVEGLICCC